MRNKIRWKRIVETLSKGKGPVLWNKWWNKISSISWPRCLFHSMFQNEGRALSFAAFYAVAEARVAFRQKEGARRSGYVDRKWSVAPRRQLLHGHPYQLFHTWPCGKRACVRVAKYSVLSRVHTRIWKIIKISFESFQTTSNLFV